MELSLAEQLTLVAVDDESGKVATSQLDLGLAGALLVQLALAGRLDVVDGRVTVLDPEPVGEPLLDEALARIGTDKPRKADHWVSTLQKNLRHRVLDELVAREILLREESTVFGIFPRTRYPERDAGPEAAIRARLDAAVLHGMQPDESTAALVGLVQAAQLRGAAFPGADRKPTEKRMTEIAGGSWGSKAVRDAVAQVYAATSAAMIATTVVVTSS
jgi:hypothetical protein